MKEDFLHFLWKNRLFEPLETSGGEDEKIEIVNVGRHNTHAGPDFFDARIRIGGTLWAGNVEIHLKASDWNRHGHQTDPIYNNTILHVVAENDIAVMNQAGAVVPAMAIAWPKYLEYNYLQLMEQHDWVNCASGLNKIDPFRVRFFLNGMAIERLQMKIDGLTSLIEDTRSDWGEVFYRMMARNFGFRQNGDPFEMLARSLPLKVMLRHRHSLFQLEALLFGQAGLLSELLMPEPYPAALLKEYLFLAGKYRLKPLSCCQWKFMRMHPLNFPTLRIAQFAAVLHRNPDLMEALFKANTVQDFIEFFRIPIADFWSDHYTFTKASVYREKEIGEDSVKLILINTVVPFLFLYGEQQGIPVFKERALKLMDEVPAENNAILRHWAASGLVAGNALESQALIHLHHHYCEQKLCLRCTIGQKLLMHTIED